MLKKLSSDEVHATPESWYIPHFMVNHNDKDRIVFDCSFMHGGQSLNQALLPGPTLGPSLLGVLLRFREYPVAISGDIKSMFHQVCLLPQDKSLLRFLWRSIQRKLKPTVYEWQVLPFGTTSSPCCPTYALQKHVQESTQPGDPLRHSIEKCFYVDNCLQSFHSSDEAKQILERLRAVLLSGGFEIRQWGSNDLTVVQHLAPEAQASSSALLLSRNHAQPELPELTLGLQWNCSTDQLSFKSRPIEVTPVTMRHIYRELASQYDPLGYLLPFTVRAKILVQKLWTKEREWDDPCLPNDLLMTWTMWRNELTSLPKITLPRCYLSAGMDTLTTSHDVHIFCDASESSYAAVAYLRSQNPQNQVEIAFLLARSRVAPKKQLSIPRLELCAALMGAQLHQVLKSELTLPVRQTFLWTDSSTVLS